MFKYVFILIFLLATISATAQIAPTHTKLLFQDNLNSGGSKSFGDITTTNGGFEANGWRVNNRNSQLLISLKDYLPHEGTIEVTMTNIMPGIMDDWAPIGLWSRRGLRFSHVNPTPGSYTFIKTEPGLTASNGNQQFVFWSCPFYGGDLSQDERFFAKSLQPSPPNWNIAQTYTFKFVWDSNHIWFFVNDVLQCTNEFQNQGDFMRQIEGFAYITLGKDNDYEAMSGPLYTGIRAFVPESEVHFKNVSLSSSAFIDRYYNGQSVSIVDINKDDKKDIYVSNYTKPNQFYIQNVDGTFSELAGSYGLNAPGSSFSSCFADFDNDGDLDMFLTSYQDPNQLYFNNGNNTFQDVSAQKGISSQIQSSVNSLAFDVENDGDIDIYVCNSNKSHVLYINRGDGQFTQRTVSNAPSGAGCRSVAGDVNQDGFTDVFYTRREAPNVLLINNGAGGFTNRAGAFGVDFVGQSMAPTLFDYDNDADLDLVVTVSRTDEDPNPLIRFFENQNGTSFTDQSQRININLDAFSAIAGDVDNDGYMDLYFPVQVARPKEVIDVSSKIYKNRGDGTFIELDQTGADVVYADARGGAFFDYNNDGKLDLYTVVRGGLLNGEEYGRNYLLENQSSGGNNYLKVSLFDQNGQIGGIGAKMSIYAAGHVNSGSTYLLGYREILPYQAYQSSGSLTQHFGLGVNQEVDVKIQTPDGKEYIYSRIKANQHFKVQPTELLPYRIELVKGDQQTGKAGQFLADSITVRVVDEQNEPIPGHKVIFQILSGNATLNGDTQTTEEIFTDQDGIARSAVKLGGTVGTENVRIQVASFRDEQHLVNSPMTLYASTQPGDPAKLLKISGDNQSGVVFQKLVDPVRVRVTDNFDNPIDNHPVEFSVVTGGGSLDDGGPAVIVLTDISGYAQVEWKLGAQAGQQSIQAVSRFENQDILNSPMVFNAIAEQPQVILSYVSGNYQTGVVNTALNPFVVKLEDFTGSPVVGESITFKVVGLESTFSGDTVKTVVTNSAGVASVVAQLGTVAGDTNYVYQASAVGAQGSPIVFKASATAGPANRIRYVSGNNQTGKVGQLLQNPFVTKVTDAYGNPVADYGVLFQVSEGDGSINGLQEKQVLTDPAGLASVRFQLGTVAGPHAVMALAEGLIDSPVLFSALASPGNAAKLVKVSGDNQRGAIGQPLENPFIIKITDMYQNAIVGHLVTFQVVKGGGKINGNEQFTAPTDGNGQVSANLVLGNTHFLNQVSVTSYFNGEHLVGSPALFRATTGATEPDSLLYVSGNRQIGRINATLTDPFKVKVTDKNGIPIEDHPVVFSAISPGSDFSGQKTFEVNTDIDGIASAYATIGSNIGDNNNVFEVRAYYNQMPLHGSPEYPIRFFASGRRSTGVKIVNITPNLDNLVGTVGKYLNDTLKVQVLDKDDVPSPGQPVVFEVTEGSSLLEGLYTTRVVDTDQNGIARVRLKMGIRPGQSIVKVSADAGVGDLLGSPLEMTIKTVIGPPSPENSSITADTSVIANGQNVAKVSVSLKDEYNNIISGKTVSLYAEGLDVTVIQPQDTTDVNGKTSGGISSIKAGVVKVWSMVDGQKIPNDNVSIRFKPGQPAQAIAFGAGQVAEMGKLLQDSVGVIVEDQFGNAVPGVTVVIEVASGGGSIIESGPFITDQNGMVAVRWVLGYPGEQYLRAYVPGVIPTPRLISAIALRPEAATIEMVSGDQQIGTINSVLEDSFKVLVKDKESRPIPGADVEFKIIDGDASFMPDRMVKTNTEGIAAVVCQTKSQTGQHQVQAGVPGLLQKVIFNFIVQAEETATIHKISGDQQSNRPGMVLDEPLLVVAKDPFDRPLQNIDLVFTVIEGGGSIIQEQPVKTNNEGKASVRWKIGKSGVQRVKVHAKNRVSEPVYFSAIVINSPPVLDIPTSFTVQTGDVLTFVVKATDADGDQISYGARNLPQSAQFDSLGNQLFSWTTTHEDAGPHTLLFIASDVYETSDSVEVNILVNPVNRKPMILNYTPADTNLSYQYGETVLFKVQSTDPDGDELSYEWKANDSFAGNKSEARIPFHSNIFPSDVLVSVIVSDGNDEVSVRWHVKLVTSVELGSFAAEIHKNAVLIYWKTKSEKNNIGFDLFKRLNEKDQWQKMNTAVIPPTATGEYRYRDTDLQPGRMCYYKLEDIDVNGQRTAHGPISITLPLPDKISLSQNYPNPFNPSTTISVELPEPQKVTLKIYNISGQLIKTIYNGKLSAGIHRFEWKGTDSNDRLITSGVYYYRLVHDTGTITKKLLFTK